MTHSLFLASQTRSPQTVDQNLRPTALHGLRVPSPHQLPCGGGRQDYEAPNRGQHWTSRRPIGRQAFLQYSSTPPPRSPPQRVYSGEPPETSSPDCPDATESGATSFNSPLQTHHLGPRPMGRARSRPLTTEVRSALYFIIPVITLQNKIIRIHNQT